MKTEKLNALERISPEEQKRILLEMLEYIDKLCRNNGIKYSLIGGSLLGAIRHKGFIPWDDDIDIILDKKNYDMLLNILKNSDNNDYFALIPNITKDYPIQFAKLINKHTILKERGVLTKIENYGLFLDIFCYNYVPDDEVERKKYYNKFHFYQRSLAKLKINKEKSLFHNLRRIAKNIYISIFGYKGNLNKILNLFDRNYKSPTNYVMSNNPAYGYDKEIQKTENIKEYINTKFENIDVMIFKNYNEILKTTFGDYMKFPPKEKRRSHGLEVYWKN